MGNFFIRWLKYAQGKAWRWKNHPTNQIDHLTNERIDELTVNFLWSCGRGFLLISSKVEEPYLFDSNDKNLKISAYC